MYTFEPFFMYSPAISPRRPNMATLCHSVRSLFSPDCLSFQLSLVATRMFATVMPEGMARVSGSAPRLPIKMTLLIPRAMTNALHRKLLWARLYGQRRYRCSRVCAPFSAVRILTIRSNAHDVSPTQLRSVTLRKACETHQGKFNEAPIHRLRVTLRVVRGLCRHAGGRVAVSPKFRRTRRGPCGHGRGRGA